MSEIDVGYFILYFSREYLAPKVYFQRNISGRRQFDSFDKKNASGPGRKIILRRLQRECPKDDPRYIYPKEDERIQRRRDVNAEIATTGEGVRLRG